jgi:hypothetical protein
MKCEVTPVPAIKEYGGVEVPLICNFCTRCSAMVSLTPGNLAFGEGSAGTHEVRDWVGTKGGLEVFKERKISCCCFELNQNSFVPYNPVEFPMGFALVTKNDHFFYLFYPTDAQLNIPRKMLKFTLKLTLSAATRFGLNKHHQGA